ncbi:MAG: hypothetical protein L0H59_10765, partial [Tomitella sp.]|nr:hypothetical protein [Tomitella sp.]
MRSLVLLAGIATLLVGCSSAQDTGSNNSAQLAASKAGIDDIGFFDPCDQEMSEWFHHRGLRPSEIMPPELDEHGSECSFNNEVGDFALLSQPAETDGSTEHRVSAVLEAEGTPQSVDIGEHQGEYVVQPTS